MSLTGTYSCKSAIPYYLKHTDSFLCFLSYRAGKVLHNRNDLFTMSSFRPYKRLHVNTISMFRARKDVGSVIEAHGYL